MSLHVHVREIMISIMSRVVCMCECVPNACVCLYVCVRMCACMRV